MGRSTILVVLVLALAAACAPGDPRAKLLEERSRWEVNLLSWAQAEDGSVILGTRVQGPSRTSLDRLTFRVQMLDSAGTIVASRWKTIDLTEIERGGPKDLDLRVPGPDEDADAAIEIDGLAIDPVPDPTADEEGKIVELAGLTP